MILAVPLKDGAGLGSAINAHFSRSPFFLIYDTKTGSASVAQNSAAHASGHEGPLSQLFDLGVRAIACSGIGPGAMDYAAELGISVCFGRGETAQGLVDKYVAGTLETMADGSLCGGD